MKPSATFASFLVIAAIPLCWGAGPADRPVSGRLSGARIEVTAPAGWEGVFTDMDDVPFRSTDGKTYIQVEAVPRGVALTPQTVSAKLKELSAKHKEDEERILNEPEIQNDDRFALRIHERYTYKKDRTIDAVYLYRMIGGRLIRLTFSCESADEDRIKADLKLAEQALLRATRY